MSGHLHRTLKYDEAPISNNFLHVIPAQKEI